MSAAAVILAGGSGTRLGAPVNKVYLPLAGRCVVSWSFTWARAVAGIDTFVLVVRAADLDRAQDVVTAENTGLDIRLVVGGDTRHDSEQAALDHLAGPIRRGDIDVVAVHDGARPLAGPGLWRSVVDGARVTGGALPAIPAIGIVAVSATGDPAAGSSVGSTHSLARVQTPQAFRAPELVSAFELARHDGRRGTDTASTVEHFSDLTVQVVAGQRSNVKVTYPHDLVLAERLLALHDYRLP